MKKLFTFLKWTLVSLLTLLIIGILYIRLTRKVDVMIYQASNFKPYEKFESSFSVEENFMTVDEDVKLHTALFKPDSIPPIATIFHCMGKGNNLLLVQKSYQPLLDAGFQIFAFEYRDVGLSTGVSVNSQTLKTDVLFLFDELTQNPSVQGKPIVVWGRSMGSAFATMTASERNDKINGLVLEGGFSSFPDIAKQYAEFIHLENVKWMIPLVMHNDFPAEEKIKHITKPVVIIHSTEDTAVPFALSQKLYDASNKETTRLWEIKGEHIYGIKLYEKEYVKTFKDMVE